MSQPRAGASLQGPDLTAAGPSPVRYEPKVLPEEAPVSGGTCSASSPHAERRARAMLRAVAYFKTLYFYCLPFTITFKSIISILDVVTDLVILIRWWQAGQLYRDWAITGTVILGASWAIPVYHAFTMVEDQSALSGSMALWGLNTRRGRPLRVLVCALQLQTLVNMAVEFQLWIRANRQAFHLHNMLQAVKHDGGEEVAGSKSVCGTKSAAALLAGGPGSGPGPGTGAETDGGRGSRPTSAVMVSRRWSRNQVAPEHTAQQQQQPLSKRKRGQHGGAAERESAAGVLGQQQDSSLQVQAERQQQGLTEAPGVDTGGGVADDYTAPDGVAAHAVSVAAARIVPAGPGPTCEATEGSSFLPPIHRAGSTAPNGLTTSTDAGKADGHRISEIKGADAHGVVATGACARTAGVGMPEGAEAAAAALAGTLRALEAAIDDEAWWKTLETVTEALPQLALQAYVALLTRQVDLFTCASMALSLLMAAWSCVWWVHNARVGGTWWNVVVTPSLARFTGLFVFFIGSIGLRAATVAYLLVSQSTAGLSYVAALALSNLVATALFVYTPTLEEGRALAVRAYGKPYDERHWYRSYTNYLGYAFANVLAPGPGLAAWGSKWDHRVACVLANVGWRLAEHWAGGAAVLLLAPLGPQCDPWDGAPRFADTGCDGCCRGPLDKTEAWALLLALSGLYVGGFAGWWWPEAQAYLVACPRWTLEPSGGQQEGPPQQQQGGAVSGKAGGAGASSAPQLLSLDVGTLQGATAAIRRLTERLD